MIPLNLQTSKSEGQYLRDKEESPERESTDMFNVDALRNFGLLRASVPSVMALYCN
jgi:hypothetical protein